MTISDAIRYVGVNDTDIDLFESQYPVPAGVSYNSYLIMDDQIALMDTVDLRKYADWSANLDAVLGARTPDYIVVHHLEPDHAGSLQKALEKYPSATLVLSAKARTMLPQFFNLPETVKTLAVKEGDTLELGSHTLTFAMAPMVHWPEVMVSYEQTEKVLFSADAFGKFGAVGTDEPWTAEARRYFINIVGKYGAPVQTLLKKASALDIQTICPLHGPVLQGDLSAYLHLYNTWSSYQPESDGVFIAYASIYGNTKAAAVLLAEELRSRGVTVELADVSRRDVSDCVAQAFRFSKMVCAAPSYDGGVFPSMADFLHHLKTKAYQNRTVALIENGSWAPSAARTMTALLEEMKAVTLLPQAVTVRAAVKDADRTALAALADALAQ